ncbi:hypothetical protein CYY_006409 [Polysphondylium violaceum]|uniref:Profilin n=1 Tax=Polysphondylium violaceum TaxID=133409 RepID=A0A8J4PRX8_9MYCE|nr:hypothetical protein CYY_006409 [Polysphondylium violaceum]
MNIELVGDIVKNDSSFYFTELYHYLIFNEEKWRDYNQLYPFPDESIISSLFCLAKKFSIDTSNVHYSICLIQRFLGLLEINKNKINLKRKTNSIYILQMSICALNLSCKIKNMYWNQSNIFKQIIQLYFEDKEYSSMELEFLDIIKFYLRVPMLSDFYDFFIELFHLQPMDKEIYQSILNIIYFKPKDFLYKPFTLLTFAIICFILILNNRNDTKYYLKWDYIKMSWQQYVDGNLIGAGLKQACILGAADGGVWATSAGFSLKAGEGATFASNYKDVTKFTANGIVANGVKYFVLKSDPRSVYGKQGAGGIVLVKTTQAILVGIYDEKLQPGAAAFAVEKVADYLIDSGY